MRLARSVVTRVFTLVTPPVLNTSTWAVSVNPNWNLNGGRLRRPKRLNVLTRDAVACRGDRDAPARPMRRRRENPFLGRRARGRKRLGVFRLTRTFVLFVLLVVRPRRVFPYTELCPPG